MNSNLKFDFVVNKENNTIVIKREFAADLELVWEAWTTAELLDKWWGPEPCRAETKTMDFREGGHWLYCMIVPASVTGGEMEQTHWGKQEYEKIALHKFFSGIDVFCDENGTANPDLPKGRFENAFSEEANGRTLVTMISKHNSLKDIEAVIAMGFKEGITVCFNQLDQYIETKFKLRKQNKTSNKARVSSYLNFDGKTEEAFLFYKSVFKTEFLGKGIERFGDIPAEAGHPPVAEEIKKMVIHVELPITGNHILMGTDAPKEMGFTLTKGNNMHICIEPETREEADRLFNELSAGGNVTMPLQDMFFGAYFAEFSDKYGINWMINFQNK